MLNSLVDNVYVLNLEKDLFKYRILERKLKEKRIKHERFVGIDGWDGDRSEERAVENFGKIIHAYKDSELYSVVSKSAARIIGHGWGAYRSSGSMGCLVSHVNILKDALKNKYERILILQDDIYFHKEFEGLLEERLDSINKSSLFYLGATEHAEWMKDSHWWWRNPHWSRDQHKRGCYKVTEKTLGMFAVIIDKKLFEPMIELVEFEILACDQSLAILGSVTLPEESFVSFPNLIMPDTSHSNTASETVGDRSFESGEIWRGGTDSKWAIEQGWDHNYYDLTEKYYE